MSNRFENRPLTTLEEQAYAEARDHFAEQLKQFPTTWETIQRLERNFAITALAADLAVSTLHGKVIQIGNGEKWTKGIDFMTNISLCHRLMDGRLEYAVVEHFPARGTNEIWHTGHNAVDVLKVFVKEREHALRIWVEDINVQVKKFLTENYPGQDMSHVAASFTRRFTHAHQQNHSRRTRI